MKRFKHDLRLLAKLQLFPAMEDGEELLVGGQAVIEGVMMRSPHAYCVAVRRQSGGIVTKTGELMRPSERRRIWKYPLLRGLGTLGQALALGIRALRFSADMALEEENAARQPESGKPESGQPESGRPESKTEVSSWILAANLVFSVGFFLFLYKFLPLFLATRLKYYFPAIENHFVFNFVDGVIRLLLFLGFLLAVSRWKEIKRVFEYHGAEHKVVFNFESRRPLTVENARTFTTLHPRCGTSFLLVVMLISMVVYTLVPVHSFALRFVVRIALLPLIAGASFELIRYAARRQGSLWASMVRPGLWLQKITTRPPSDEQLEVSIRALKEAMRLEEARGGELVIA
jgi:uncharacterized protein YqhQ